MSRADFRLIADLDLSSGRVHLDVGGGVVARLPDDRAVVAALDDVDPGRPHTIALDGRELAHLGRARRVRAGLVVVGEPQLAADVRVRDHLGAAARGREVDRWLGQVPQLAARAGDPVGVLSGGERRLLGWVSALALAPRCLVLDRAGTGLDAASLAWAHGAVDRVLAGGAAVLVRVGRAEESAWVTHTSAGHARG